MTSAEGAVPIVGPSEIQGDDISYRVQHLQMLKLSERPQQFYSDRDYGPVKPGYQFYRWLFQGGALRIPIADTILVERDVVRVLRTVLLTKYVTM